MDAGAAWQSLNPMVQLGLGGPVDLSHPPLADEGSDVVVAESGADGEGHELDARILCPRSGSPTQNCDQNAHDRISRGCSRSRHTKGDPERSPVDESRRAAH